MLIELFPPLVLHFKKDQYKLKHSEDGLGGGKKKSPVRKAWGLGMFSPVKTQG